MNLAQIAMMKCCPFFIVIYLLFLVVLTVLFIPVVPVMLLITYIRDGTLEVPPLDVDDSK